MSHKKAKAAIKTLEAAGYTYLEGAAMWKPPLGKRPDFERMAAAVALIHLLCGTAIFQATPEENEEMSRLMRAVFP